MERTITLIGEGFIAAREETAELRADMAAGFTAVDARFDQVKTELRGIKDQLAS